MVTEPARRPSSAPPTSESLPVAALLTVGGGFLDAFTYVGHGHVFANAMTGNVVLLGLALATGAARDIWRYLLPIIAFLIGVITACLIRSGLKSHPHRPGHASLVLEIAFLGTVAMLPKNVPDRAIVLGIAFVAAIQSTMFTRVVGDGFNSTVTTANLRRFAERLCSGLMPVLDKTALAQSARLFTICACFLLGALAGGIATPKLHNAALLVPNLLFACALVLDWHMSKNPAGREAEEKAVLF
jgi:uncharacterized membrane protein YoaK (UPF0700 family)